MDGDKWFQKWNQHQVLEVDRALYALLSLMWEIKLISYKTLEIASTCNTKLLEVADTTYRYR